MTKDAISTSACMKYEYKYTVDQLSYYSPLTEKMWDYSKYIEVKGTWRYDKGGSFECAGSDEKGLFGIGCSNGRSSNYRLVGYHAGTFSSSAGTGDICQGKPNIWKKNCKNAQIFFRCSDGRLKGKTYERV